MAEIHTGQPGNTPFKENWNNKQITMKASELRIGNWVWNDVQEIPVQVDVRIISQQTYRKPNQGLWEPIPLTEEWLLKFGFAEKYKSASNRWNIKGFELHDCEDDHGDLKGDFMYKFQLHVKYVHQLQNLYFALIGQELTINDL